MRVLFIAGASRSGSTLLDRMLGSTPGFASLGEIHNIWDRGYLLDHRCGCGDSFSACPVWGQVRLQLEAELGLDAREILDLRRQVVRTRKFPLMLMGRISHQNHLYSGALSALFRSAAGILGSDVVVDSSKRPAHGAVLLSANDLDVSVIHLVRDSRAMAFSASRIRDKTDAEPGARMATLTPAASARGWLRQNLLSEVLASRANRSIRLRYEDLVLEPRAVLANLAQSLDLELDLSWLSGSMARFEVSHTVSGNPMRLTRGPTELLPDEAWRDQLDNKSRRLITALTLPLLVRYGYR